MRLCVKRFAGAANDNCDGAPHPFTISTPFGEQILARFARHACKSHGEGIIPVKWNAKVRVESKQGVCNSWEEP